MKREFGDDLYLLFKALKTDIGSSSVWLQKGSDEPLTTVQSNIQELVLVCFRQNYHLFPDLRDENGFFSHAKLPLDSSSVPRRFLVDKSLKGISGCFSIQSVVLILLHDSCLFVMCLLFLMQHLPALLPAQQMCLTTQL